MRNFFAIAFALFAIGSCGSSWFYPGGAVASYANLKSTVFASASSHYGDAGGSVLSGVTAYSVQAWFNASVVNGDCALVAKDDRGTPQRMFQIEMSQSFDGLQNMIYFYTWDNSASAGRGKYSNSISLNAWHHVLATFNAAGGGVSALYIDGVAQTNPYDFGGFTAITSTSAPLLVGAYTPDGVTKARLCDAKIDEVAMWDTALPALAAADLAAAPRDLNIATTNYTQTANLKNWYRMGDLTDTSAVIYDRKGTADLTLNNSPSFSTSVP